MLLETDARMKITAPVFSQTAAHKEPHYREHMRIISRAAPKFLPVTLVFWFTGLFLGWCPTPPHILFSSTAKPFLLFFCPSKHYFLLQVLLSHLRIALMSVDLSTFPFWASDLPLQSADNNSINLTVTLKIVAETIHSPQGLVRDTHDKGWWA